MPLASLLLAKLRKGGDGAICTNNVSFKTLEQFIPTTKADYEKQKAVKHARSLDQGQPFTASKVRATVSCDSCSTDRAIFSQNAVGTKKGPNKNQLERHWKTVIYVAMLPMRRVASTSRGR